MEAGLALHHLSDINDMEKQAKHDNCFLVSVKWLSAWKPNAQMLHL